MPRHVDSRARARASPPTRRTPHRLGRQAIFPFVRRGRGTAEGEEEQSGGEACLLLRTRTPNPTPFRATRRMLLRSISR
eukprot:scaffold1792_cov124-Isochrysis_galbana.AAC.1